MWNFSRVFFHHYIFLKKLSFPIQLFSTMENFDFSHFLLKVSVFLHFALKNRVYYNKYHSWNKIVSFFPLHKTCLECIFPQISGSSLEDSIEGISHQKPTRATMWREKMPRLDTISVISREISIISVPARLLICLTNVWYSRLRSQDYFCFDIVLLSLRVFLK